MQPKEHTATDQSRRRTDGAVTTAQAVKTPVARREVRSLLEGQAFRDQIAKVLPRHITPERMIRVAITATMRTPKLLQCTSDSLTGCLLTCSQFGLEPDGRRAHLIPFEDRRNNVTICTLIIDYKGLVELAMRSGLVSHIHADVVREGDLFEYSCGEIVRHVPWFLRRDVLKPTEPGEDIAVYALARMKDGASAMAVLSIDEVYAIRDASQGWQAFQKGYTKKSPWDPADWVSEQEMKKKTAIRRLSKLLPLSPEFRDAVEADDDGDAQMRNVTPEPARPQFLATNAAVEIPAVEADPTRTDSQAREPEPDPAPADPAPAAAPSSDTPQSRLAAVVVEAGSNFDAFLAWALREGFVAEGDRADCFDDIPDALCNRLLKAKDGLVKQLKGGAV